MGGKIVVPMLICVGLLASGASYAAPVDDTRFKGLAWLLSNQNGDGSWGNSAGLKVVETASGVEALANAGITSGDSFNRAVAWLENYQAASTDSLSRQALALYKAGRDVSGLTTRLLGYANESSNGNKISWGAYDHFGGSSLDTALAMDTLRQTGANYPDAGFGLGYIVNQQNVDGGWPYFKSTVGTPASNVIPTAQTVLTLNRYKSNFGVQSLINNGIAWLRTQQRSGGGFGEGATGTVLETTLAYRAIVAEAGTNDQAAVNAQTFLIAQQQTNGGWGGNDPLLAGQSLAALPSASLTDTDKDGLPDGIETPALLGTNPNVPDGTQFATGNGQSVAGTTTATVLSPATLNQAYSATVPANGVASPSVWAVTSGRIPDGLTLNAGTGLVSGVPTAVGSFNFTVQIAGSSASVSAINQIDVTAAASPTQVPALPNWALALLGLMLVALSRRQLHPKPSRQVS